MNTESGKGDSNATHMPHRWLDNFACGSSASNLVGCDRAQKLSNKERDRIKSTQVSNIKIHVHAECEAIVEECGNIGICSSSDFCPHKCSHCNIFVNEARWSLSESLVDEWQKKVETEAFRLVMFFLLSAGVLIWKSGTQPFGPPPEALATWKGRHIDVLRRIATSAKM